MIDHRVIAAAAARKEAVKTLSAATTAREAAQDELRCATQARDIVQHAAQTVQENVHKQISVVVTKCLAAVFGANAYEFRIVFERKRNRTEARLVFTRDGNEYDPVDSTGGGCVSVAAFALRLACLLAKRPQPRKFICLDEAFAMVSRQYVPAVRTMLEVVCAEMGVQIVQVSHVPGLEAGTVIDLSRD